MTRASIWEESIQCPLFGRKLTVSQFFWSLSDSYELMYKGSPLTSPPTEGVTNRNAEAERGRENNGATMQIKQMLLHREAFIRNAHFIPVQYRNDWIQHKGMHWIIHANGYDHDPYECQLWPFVSRSENLKAVSCQMILKCVQHAYTEHIMQWKFNCVFDKAIKAIKKLFRLGLWLLLPWRTKYHDPIFSFKGGSRCTL